MNILYQFEEVFLDPREKLGEKDISSNTLNPESNPAYSEIYQMPSSQERISETLELAL